MNVGKDPFPRDEVTGLAAFEHLEPVGTVSVISEKSRETHVLSGPAANSGEDTLPKAPLSSNGNADREPITRPRADATLPLDLTAMPHWGAVMPVKVSEAADDDGLADDQEIGDEAHDAAPEASAKPKSALDALFDKSAGLANLDWDDEDEATRVHSRPAGRAPNEEGGLDVDWDDDEPPTETLPFALLDAPPIAARVDPDAPAPRWTKVNDDKASHFLGSRGSTSIRSATPTIRTTTPPLHLHSTLPPQQLGELGSKLLNGGRPSPFPAALSAQALPVAAADSGSDYEDQDDDYDSAFKNLMPLPAPVLPAPHPAPAPRSVTLTPAPSRVEHVARPPLELATSETPARFIDALKAGHRPSLIIAAGGAVGLLALVVIARAIAVTTNVGTAVLEVSPADAQVQVDGKSVAGTGSPYTVSDLKAGSHELLAKKRGYNDYRGNFTVSAGQSTKVPVLELAPNLLDVGFSVRSVPAGATVWLDGERTEALTPAKLTGIKPGIHRLALKHDGFSDYELQMFVPEATVLQLPAAELVALAGAEPEPALNSRRRPRGSSPHHGSSNETLTSVSARHASSAYGSRSARRDADDDAVASMPSKSSAADDKAKVGTLRLNSRPWAQVSVDGRPIGNTPQPNLQLSAGRHKLLLANPQLGVNKNVTVTIKPGETLTQVVNLAE